MVLARTSCPAHAAAHLPGPAATTGILSETGMQCRGQCSLWSGVRRLAIKRVPAAGPAHECPHLSGRRVLARPETPAVVRPAVLERLRPWADVAIAILVH